MATETTGFFSFLDHLNFVEDDSSSYEIGIGDNGFSYLDRVSEKKAKEVTFAEKQNRSTSAALDGSTGARGKHNIRKVEKIDHDAICLDTNLDDIIRDIQARKKRIAFFPIGVAAFIILFVIWCMLPDWMARTLSGLLLFPLGLVGLLNLWKLDVSRRHATLTYRFTGGGLAAYQTINSRLEQLSRSQQVLLLTGFKHFDDTRYSGGADRAPDFDLTKIDQRRPPLIEMETPVWHIRANRRDLYFMPDHLMVYDGSQIGGINYSQLDLASRADRAQAREKAIRTHDCTVVGTTYRFVNNDGSPDKRFNNNIEIPILDYGVLCLSGAGLDMRLYASHKNAGTAAASGFDAIRKLAAQPVVQVAASRHNSPSTELPVAAPERKPDVFGILLNAMCCVMAADGKVTSVEKQHAARIMKKVKSPLSEADVAERIGEFIRSTKRNGFNGIVQSTREDVRVFQKTGKSRLVISCLESMAKADGDVADAERRVIEYFKSVLE
ncbi:TerB family tellurite resistance protein [Planctomycetota bacterium]